MDMDQAAVFLAGSILTALGFLVIVAAIVAVNNILHKYWKPVEFTWFSSLYEHSNKRFVDPEPLHSEGQKEPHLNTK